MNLSFMNKPTDFFKYVDEVIQWNSTALGGTHDFSPAKIALQKTFVEEEYKELKDAIESQDKQEVADALADLIVTAGYWMYLKDPHLISNSCRLLNFSMGANYVKMIGYAINNDDAWTVLQHTIALFMQVDCLVDKTMKEVLESNWSKFASVEGFSNEQKDAFSQTMSAAIEKNGRYTGVSATEVNGKLVFKSGKGKLLKCPDTFKEPDHTNHV